MTRPRWLPVVVLAALPPLSAAPVPKAKPAADLHPSAVGTKWEYVRNGDANAVYAEEVTECVETDGVKAVVLTITPNAGDARVNKLEVRKDGVYLTEASSITIDTPFPVQKAGVAAGDTWTGNFERNGVTFRYEFTVGKPEEVTTPAGKFTATPVVRKLTPNQAEYVYWYAEGVGMVKQTTNGKPVQELKAFIPAKEKK